MGINFPASPALNQKWPQPAVAGIPVYTWDGEKWTTVGGSIAAYAPPADAVPLMDATPGLVGTATEYAREDHVHPTDSAIVAANLIINGDFRINQGGYVSAAALVAGTYGHDQWKAGASGGDYSFTQLKSSTQITIASGKSLIQPIEDVNIIGGSYVLRWTGTAQARAGVNTLTPAGSYAASPLLITGQTAGTAMSIEFNNGTLGTVKLESGSNATPFVMRAYDQELATCKRYYNSILVTAFWYAHIAAEHLSSTFSFPTMRAIPTAAFVNYGSNANIYTGYPNLSISSNTFGYADVANLAAGPVSIVDAVVSLDARL